MVLANVEILKRATSHGADDHSVNQSEFKIKVILVNNKSYSYYVDAA